MTAMTALAPGSSPLTRGKHLVPSFGTASPRLIPAHAGKTRPKTRLGAYRRAHPRSRGENDRGERVHLRASGSSPLTRGKLTSCEIIEGITRLIPAHAGKTRTGM